MKRLAIWLMLLLAVLLPVWGTVAAAMGCASRSHDDQMQLGHVQLGQAQHGRAQNDQISQASSPAQAHAGHDRPRHDHERQDHAAQELSGGPTPGQHGQAASVDDGSRCANFCTLTPLASAPLDVRPPQAETALNPAPIAAAMSYLSSGEERPPRTI